MRDLWREVNRAPGAVSRLLGEWFRFGIVGIAATATYLAASLLTRSAGLEPYLANLAGYLSSVAISYFGHATITFRSSRPHRVQAPKFVIVSCLTFGLTNLIVFVMVDLLERSFLEASLAVACSIPAATWLLARFWVFQRR